MTGREEIVLRYRCEMTFFLFGLCGLARRIAAWFFMFLFRIESSRTRLRFGGALLVFVLPLLAGGWIIHSNYMQDLKADSSASAHKARTLLEAMLDHAEQANRSVLPLVNAPCDENLLVLRKKVAIEPFLRSVNLVRDGIISCTSLFGAVSDADDRSNLYRQQAVADEWQSGAAESPVDSGANRTGQECCIERHRQHPAQLHALSEWQVQRPLSAGGVGLARRVGSLSQ